MTSLRLGVDLDGVCYDFTDSLRGYLVAEHGFDPRHLPTPEKWETWDAWGMDVTQWLDYCHQGVDAGYVFRTGEPMPGTVDTLHLLRERGHRVHLVTNRTFGTRSVRNTEEWLVEHEVPYDTLTFSADKTVIPVDLFIDDYTVNVDALLNAGIPAVIRNQPWNYGYTSAPRVFDWAHFLHVVRMVEAVHDGDVLQAIGVLA